MRSRGAAVCSCGAGGFLWRALGACLGSFGHSLRASAGAQSRLQPWQYELASPSDGRQGVQAAWAPQRNLGVRIALVSGWGFPERRNLPEFLGSLKSPKNSGKSLGRLLAVWGEEREDLPGEPQPQEQGERLALGLSSSPWRNCVTLSPGTVLLDCLQRFGTHEVVFGPS